MIRNSAPGTLLMAGAIRNHPQLLLPFRSFYSVIPEIFHIFVKIYYLTKNTHEKTKSRVLPLVMHSYNVMF